MKKNRPAVKLTVLAPIEQTDELAAVMLRETSTLGVRIHRERRLKCRRWQDTVTTPWGDALVKVKQFGDVRTAAPEYDDCLRISREAGVPLAEVYRIVTAAAHTRGFNNVDE